VGVEAARADPHVRAEGATAFPRVIAFQPDVSKWDARRPERRMWLRDALERVHPEHAWLEAL